MRSEGEEEADMVRWRRSVGSASRGNCTGSMTQPRRVDGLEWSGVKGRWGRGIVLLALDAETGQWCHVSNYLGSCAG